MNQLRNTRDWIRYRADNALSKGIGIVLLWVGFILITVISIVSLIIWLTDSGPNDERTNFAEALWISLTRSLDPGTFGADQGLRFRIATLVITLIGLLLLATLIGLVSNSIDRRIEELRRGKSVVLESGHSLILGISQKLPMVVKEIIEANRSVHKHSIVILTSEDKVEVEDNLRNLIPDFGTIRLVVRRGEPSSINDLLIVNPISAKVVIILAADVPRPDARTVKTALAVLTVRGADSKAPVIIEVAQDHTASALRQALPKNFLPIITNEVISKVAAHTSRSAGIGAVYQELLGFDGNEFYFAQVPTKLVGQSFATAAESMSQGVLVGIEDHRLGVKLLPDINTLLTENDRLLVLAEDDTLIRISPEIRRSSVDPFDEPFVCEVESENLLVLGWNPTARWILREIDRRVVPGSRLTVMAHPLVSDNAQEFLHDGLVNHQHSLIVGDSTSFPEIYRVLENGNYDHVLVLGSMRFETRTEADASTLLTLMHVRSALNELGASGGIFPNIVAELNDEDSVALAKVADPDDFIVSHRLVSLLMAQLSESPELFAVFGELLDPFGVEINLIRASEVLPIGEYSMAEVTRLLLGRGVLALGWELPLSRHIGGSLQGRRLRLNPSREERLHVSDQSRLVLLTRGRSFPRA